MKPAVMVAFGVVGVILVTSEVVALLATSEPVDPLPSTPSSRNINFVFPLSLYKDVPSPIVLSDGIYETLPFAILLKKTGDVGDNCVLGNPEPLLRMSVQHPKLRLVPISHVEK